MPLIKKLVKWVKTAQRGVATESGILDERVMFDIETKELVTNWVMAGPIRPVFSIPLEFDDERQVWELATPGAPVSSRIRGYFSTIGFRELKDSGYGDVALDNKQRLMVNTDPTFAIANQHIPYDEVRYIAPGTVYAVKEDITFEGDIVIEGEFVIC